MGISSRVYYPYFVQVVKGQLNHQVWKAARLVFIPKPRHISYAEANDYRLISLTSFILKTLEKLVERHVCGVMIPLNVSHHAYQSGRGYIGRVFYIV